MAEALAVERLHPHLSDFSLEFLRQDCESTLAAPRPLLPDVFAVASPFHDQLSQELQAELRHFQAECARRRLKRASPSVLRHSGALLSDMGLQSLATGLVEQVLSPMVEKLFPQTRGLRTDEVLGMLLLYDGTSASDVKSDDVDAAKDSGMVSHCDDSCITFDICLGEDFEGGELVFAASEGHNEECVVKQQPGQATLFAGHLKHWCRPLSRGRRVNLVLWCMSKARAAMPGTFQRYSEYLSLVPAEQLQGQRAEREDRKEEADAEEEAVLPAPSPSGGLQISFDVPTDYLRAGRKAARMASKEQGSSDRSIERSAAARHDMDGKPDEALDEKGSPGLRPSACLATAVLGLCGVRISLEQLLYSKTRSERDSCMSSMLAIQRLNRTCRQIYGRMAFKATHFLGNPKSSREVISLQLGGCGASMGAAMWSLFCAEYGMTCRGHVPCDHKDDDDAGMGVFFGEMGKGRWRPRSIYVDQERGALDELVNLRFAPLAPADLVTPGADGTTDSLLDGVFDAVRRHAECCDSLQGFMFLHGSGGSASSRLLPSCLSGLSEEFDRKHRLTATVLPSVGERPGLACINSAIAVAALLENADASVVFEREKLWNICNTMGYPSCMKGWDRGADEIVAHLMSSLTATMRFEGSTSMHEDLRSISLNHCPMPGLHFLTSAVAPLYTSGQSSGSLSCAEISAQALEDRSALAGSPSLGKYISLSLSYRGEVVPKDVMAAVASIKTKRIVEFADWSPCGFKCAIDYRPPVSAPGGLLHTPCRRVTMLACNTSLSHTFEEMSKDLLNSKAASASLRRQDSQMQEKSLEELSESLVAVHKNYVEAGLEGDVADDDDGEEEF